MAGAVERELKLDVAAAFQVPELTSVPGVSVVSLPELELSATYYDTAALDLARWGATLRFRVSSSGSQTWTLKIPTDANGPGLARSEIDFEGPGDRVPTGALRPVAGYVRDRPVTSVARLDTRRRRHLLLFEEHTLAELDDDTVDFKLADGTAGSFREIEVEMAPGCPAATVRQVAQALRRAGARPSAGIPKVVRALGGPPPEPFPTWPGPLAAGSVRALVGGVLTASGRELHLLDPALRLGDDPAAVRRAAWHLERLRACLDALSAHLAESWWRDWDPLLRRAADVVSELADIDLVAERLLQAARRLPAGDQAVAGELAGMLAGQREVQRRALEEHMDGLDHRALLDGLAAAAAEPPVARKASAAALPVVEAAARRALDVLADAVEGRVPPHPSRRAPSGGPEHSDLEAIRSAARSAAYAAGMAATAVGKPASKLVGRLERLESGLDSIRISGIAQAWLRQTAPALGGAEALVAGELVAGEAAAAAELRHGWAGWWRAVLEKAGQWPPG